MNEKKAKELRRMVYGDEPRKTEYQEGHGPQMMTLTHVSLSHVLLGAKQFFKNPTAIACGNRRVYQDMKHNIGK